MMKKRKSKSNIGIAALVLLLGAGGVMTNAVPWGAPVVLAKDMQSDESSTETVVGETTSWKYLDNNTDPAEGLASLTAWTQKDFNDSGWKKEAGKFGAKKGQLTSIDGFLPTILLQQYKSEEERIDIPTYFFRTTFTIADISELTSITGKLYHDDAVAVYLNGQNILSVDMPTAPQENNMFYAGVSAGAPKEALVNLSKEQIKKLAVEGENVLAVELHNDRETSSDIYFEFSNLDLNYNEVAEESPVEQKSVILTVGSDETKRNVTWYTNTSEEGELQYAKKSDMADGAFPVKYEAVKSTAVSANDAGFYSNQATIANIEGNTEYVYRLKNGETTSDSYFFSTGQYDSEFRFALVGDPQIGTGNLQNGIDGWDKTMEVITAKLDPDFILSAGDQVNTASNETEYAGYLNENLTSIPSASTIGNHDSGSAAYGQHFNLPNESADKGVTVAGSDYWYVFGNTLFMDINTNNRSTAEHKAFMEEAIAANPDVRWKTVVFHHSIYSTASHVNDSDIITRREELPQVFTDLDIDVVLMGHDHVYTRTYMMDGFTPDRAQGVQSSVLDPAGILYLTANSASGSKYYDIEAPDAEYAAKQDQSYRRTVTDVKVSNTSYTMTTYYADDMSVLDTFTIQKTPETDNTQLKELITKGENLKESDYTAESFQLFKKAYLAAVDIAGNENASQEEIDLAYNNLKTAMDGLKTKSIQPGGSQQTGSSQNQTAKLNQTNATVKSTVPKTGDTTDSAAAGMLMMAAGSMIVLVSKKKLLK